MIRRPGRLVGASAVVALAVLSAGVVRAHEGAAHGPKAGPGAREQKGQVLHELVIGTREELDAHAALMQKHPGMEHDEPYMAHVGAGRSGALVWQFNRAGTFEFACLIPGHYQAGMMGTILVHPR